MTITLETGAGIAAANSYATETMYDSYTDDRGLTTTAGADVESALVRASAWIDVTYRDRFPGVRTFGQSQGLLWPRKSGSIVVGTYVQTDWLAEVTDAEGLPIPINSIPPDLVRATIEAARREIASPGSLAPDLERGGAIRSLKAGSVAIEYASSAPMTTTFQLIEGILANILMPKPSQYTGRAVRA